MDFIQQCIKLGFCVVCLQAVIGIMARIAVRRAVMRITIAGIRIRILAGVQASIQDILRALSNSWLNTKALSKGKTRRRRTILVSRVIESQMRQQYQ